MREAGHFPGLPYVISMTFSGKKFAGCVSISLIAVPLGIHLSIGLRGTALLTVLFLCIGLWITEAIPKWLTSLVLLASFSLLSTVPMKKIFQFPLSENFAMIILSYLFSQGLQNTRMFDKLLPILQKSIHNTFTLAFSIFLCSFSMIWIVPQPFARIIIILQLYQTLFQTWTLSEKTCQILCLGIVNSSIFINCAFLRGDIILNNALVNTSSIPITEAIWMDWMLIPTLGFYTTGMALFYWTFRKDLSETAKLTADNSAPALEKKQTFHIPAAVICGAAVLLLLTEPWTGIPAAWTVLAADLVMGALGYLKPEDLKSIDIKLIVFLSAAFSIGPVMVDSGIAQSLFQRLLPLMPQTFNPAFIILLILASIILHLILGSCITMLSIMIPSIPLLCQGKIPELPVMFLLFLSIACQYLFPLQNVSIMVGAGKGRYSEHTVLRWGVVLTVYILFALPVFYGGYWFFRGIV